MCEFVSLIYTFYLYATLFSIQLPCFSTQAPFRASVMTRASNVAWVLLNTYEHHLRHFLYLLCLCPCLDLRLFMSSLRDLFFIYIFTFIMINLTISWIQTHLFFCLFFRICHCTKKWSFPLRISSVNVTKSAVSCGLNYPTLSVLLFIIL